MTDTPVDLDDYRSMLAQKETVDRREHVRDFLDDQQALRKSQEELEKFLLAAPAETWSEAGAQALYLIQIFATTAEAQDTRRKQLITQTIKALKRLCTQAPDQT